MRIGVLALLLATLPYVAAAEDSCRVPKGDTIQGTVSRILDGDTFVLESKSIRLFGLDAPDRGLKGYREAREALERVALGQTASCEVRGYNRTRCVAVCIIDGRDVSAEMIRSGHGFAFRSFSQPSDRRDNYDEAEQEARRAQRGFWRKAD